MTPTHRPTEPVVSVVVPTRNSERTIGLCLASISEQTYPNIETVVVDQMSEDGTRRIVPEFGAKLILAPSGGTYLPPTLSRNTGTAVSSGQYLLHIDSDMELPPKLIQSCLELAEEGAGAVVIPETDCWTNFWGHCKALERSCYLGDPVFETPRFFSREVLLKIGGYDEDIRAGEDWDLNFRLRDADVSIARTDQYIKHHIEDFDLLRNLKKKYDYSRSFGRYREKHPQASRETLTILRPAYWRNRRRLATHPVLAGGFGVLKLFEGLCSWMGMLRPLRRETASLQPEDSQTRGGKRP